MFESFLSLPKSETDVSSKDVHSLKRILVSSRGIILTNLILQMKNLTIGVINMFEFFHLQSTTVNM